MCRYLIERFNVFHDEARPVLAGTNGESRATRSDRSSLRKKFIRVASPSAQEARRINIVHRMCTHDGGRSTASDLNDRVKSDRSGGTYKVRRPSVIVGSQFRSRYLARKEVLSLVEKHMRGNILRMVHSSSLVTFCHLSYCVWLLCRAHGFFINKSAFRRDPSCQTFCATFTMGGLKQLKSCQPLRGKLPYELHRGLHDSKWPQLPTNRLSQSNAAGVGWQRLSSAGEPRKAQNRRTQIPTARRPRVAI